MTADGPKSQARVDKSARRPELGAGERFYRGAVRGFSLAFVAIGFVVLIATLVHGGGPLSTGFLLGFAFVGVGAGRLWVNSRMAK